MSTPEKLLYSKTHEWVEFIDDTTALVGITDHAQSSLGELVFINLPNADAKSTAGEVIFDVESVKAVSDIYSPVTGVVTEVNEAVADAPGLINENPYGSWLVRVSNVSDRVELLDAAAYDEFVKSEQ